MKIKHFAGYGTVNAKKIFRKDINRTTTLRVLITGNHEYGLSKPFNDPYLIYNWIVKRYDKREVLLNTLQYICDDGYTYDNGSGKCIEYAEYTICYQTK